jgi:hypothetical protein
MARWKDSQRIHGVVVAQISPDQWQWRHSSGLVWTFELWGHKLFCANEMVAQGISSLPRAVDISLGYEMGVADMNRKASLESRQASEREKKKAVIIRFPDLDSEEVR